MTPMKSGVTIVFGGAGFIGTHLLRRLQANGENSRLISVDIKRPARQVDGVEYVQADVRDLSGFEFPDNTSLIYNFAAVHTTPGHPTHEYYETNIAGALEITRLAAQHNVPEIVFTSSISVYGPGEDRKTENSLLTPVSAYGYSKMLAEKVHKNWHGGEDGRKLTIVRPAVVFGAGEGGNFTRLAKLMKKGFFIYPGRKDTIKSCISVHDLLDAIEFARSRNTGFIVFNGAYPERYTLMDIVNTFAIGHFKNVKTVNLPKWVVLGAAKLLRVMDVFKLGVHPERVLKLIRSTDVYPEWLVSQGREYPQGLARALDRWSKETNGRFN